MSALKTITFYAMMAAFIAAVCWLSDSPGDGEPVQHGRSRVGSTLETDRECHAESPDRAGGYSDTTTQP